MKMDAVELAVGCDSVSMISDVSSIFTPDSTADCCNNDSATLTSSSHFVLQLVICYSTPKSMCWYIDSEIDMKMKYYSQGTIWNIWYQIASFVSNDSEIQSFK